MLSFGCRRFLNVARPGIDTAHRRRCATCDRYVALLEQIALQETLLPETLSTSLRQISEFEDSLPQSPWLAFPAMDGLPSNLRSDLQAIFRPPWPSLPRFLGSPIYSVAASYVLVVAMTLLWGNPYNTLQPKLSSVQTSAVVILDHGNDLLSSWFDKVRAGFSRQSQRALRLGERIAQQVQKIESPLVPEKLNREESKGVSP